MPISPLRLRFAAAFAFVLATILGIAVAVVSWQQWSGSQRRLDARLRTLAADVGLATVRDLTELHGRSPVDAVADVARRWPHAADGFLVLDEVGRPLARRDPHALSGRALAALPAASAEVARLDRDGDDARALRQPLTLDAFPDVHLDIVTFESTESIEHDVETLAATLGVAIPILVLMSLVGGYLLAGRALAPIDRLGDAIDRIAPDDLAARLVPSQAHDEITRLAHRVNTLLARVEAARLSKQRFVREAAHQIRTPLTLVLGEAEHARASRRDQTDDAATLERIHRAAQQMGRRVDELLLFAEADSGVPIHRDDAVELDAIVFECTDLMRARAAALGRRLALAGVAPVTVRGNAALVREAVLEMLENACRHGDATASVTVAVEHESGSVHVIVRSAAESGAQRTGSGLGVPILDWIAAGHGGRFARTERAGVHEARLTLSIDPS